MAAAGRSRRQGCARAKLKFELEGEKLRGAWMLVRRHGPQAAKPQWLLFKVHDEQARNEAEFIVTRGPAGERCQRARLG